MSTSSNFGCPWCSHASDDRATFRTHLMVEHRKSDVVDFVVEQCTDDEASPEEAEPVVH